MVRNVNNVTHTGMRTRALLSMVGVLLVLSVVLSGCGQQSADTTSAQSSQASSSAIEQTQEITVEMIITGPDGTAPVQKSVVLDEDATVMDAVIAADPEAVIEDSQYGKYLTSLNDIAAEGSSGWVYTVNGEEVMDSIDAHALSDGDTVEFEYITM